MTNVDKNVDGFVRDLNRVMKRHYDRIGERAVLEAFIKVLVLMIELHGPEIRALLLACSYCALEEIAVDGQLLARHLARIRGPEREPGQTVH
jgi:hypothetical protein